MNKTAMTAMIVVLLVSSACAGDDYVDGGRACAVQANYWCGGPTAPRSHALRGHAGTSCFYAYLAMCPVGALVLQEDHDDCMEAIFDTVTDELPTACLDMWSAQ